MLAKPYNAPALPAGIFVGYLSREQLDQVNPPSGNAAHPLDTPIVDEYFAVSERDQRWIPWMVLKNKCDCISSNGRFASEYTAQGVKCCQ